MRTESDPAQLVFRVDGFAPVAVREIPVHRRSQAAIEVVGGLLLIVGLGVHWAAVPLAANMTVATYIQKFKIGAPFQGGDVQGYELDVLMLAGAVTLILGGAGPISIDAAIGQF